MVGMNILQSQNGISHIRQRRQQYVRLQTRLQNLCPQYGQGQNPKLKPCLTNFEHADFGHFFPILRSTDSFIGPNI